MGAQRVKEEKPEEKPEEKKEEKPKEGKEPEKEIKAAKRWKGKDWFVIFSPRMFGESAVAETPATDPKTLKGRSVSITLSDLLGERTKNSFNIILKAETIQGRNIHTRFNGLVTPRERITRFVRKRLQKVECVSDLTTKDEWEIRVKSIAVLNRNTETNVKKRIRAHVSSKLESKIPSSLIDDVVRSVITGNIQSMIRKTGNKIYPIRFYEIAKIEVKKMPKLSKPEPVKPDKPVK
jgi:ribosomal protein S3AE